MIINLFGKQITINNKKWKKDLLTLSLYYRTEIVLDYRNQLEDKGERQNDVWRTL